MWKKYALKCLVCINNWLNMFKTNQTLWHHSCPLKFSSLRRWDVNFWAPRDGWNKWSLRCLITREGYWGNKFISHHSGNLKLKKFKNDKFRKCLLFKTKHWISITFTWQRSGIINLRGDSIFWGKNTLFCKRMGPLLYKWKR